MNNIFENAYFGKAYKTRNGRKAIFSRKDGDTFDLETEESYNPVRADGSFLYTKEGHESSFDIVSEWEEEINEEELDRLANEYVCNYGCEHYDDGVEAYKAGYKQALSI